MKEKCVSALSLSTRTRDFQTLRPNIFPKTKKFAKPFVPVNLGPRWNILSKNNGRKSRDAVPLMQNTTLIHYTQYRVGFTELSATVCCTLRVNNFWKKGKCVNFHGLFPHFYIFHTEERGLQGPTREFLKCFISLYFPHMHGRISAEFKVGLAILYFLLC